MPSSIEEDFNTLLLNRLTTEVGRRHFTARSLAERRGNTEMKRLRNGYEPIDQVKIVSLCFTR